jgi:hypothetical protein
MLNVFHNEVHQGEIELNLTTICFVSFSLSFLFYDTYLIPPFSLISLALKLRG